MAIVVSIIKEKIKEADPAEQYVVSDEAPVSEAAEATEEATEETK